MGGGVSLTQQDLQQNLKNRQRKQRSRSLNLSTNKSYQEHVKKKLESKKRIERRKRNGSFLQKSFSNLSSSLKVTLNKKAYKSKGNSINFRHIVSAKNLKKPKLKRRTRARRKTISYVGKKLLLESEQAQKKRIELDQKGTITTKKYWKRKEEDQTIINGYYIVRKIAESNFSRVKLCMDENNRAFVMKIINRTKLEAIKNDSKNKKSGGNKFDNILKEIEILKRFGDNPNIVKLYEIINDPKEDNIYLILEALENGDLEKYLKKTQQHGGLSPRSSEGNKKFVKIIKDIIEGVSLLHSKNVIHRDIKPENILVDGLGISKLTDFNSAEIVTEDDDLLYNTEGTPSFFSPESLNSGDDGYSGKAYDVWCIGVTVYKIIYEMYPFAGQNFKELSHSILSDELIFPKTEENEVYNEEILQDLISSCLKKNPKQRITLDELKKHPYFLK